MTQERKTRWVARGGVFLSTALWLLVAVAAVQASPTAAPVNIDPPTITGTARAGEVLTAQNGTWENSPAEFRYRWLRCNRLGNSCVLLAADGRPHVVRMYLPPLRPRLLRAGEDQGASHGGNGA